MISRPFMGKSSRCFQDVRENRSASNSPAGWVSLSRQKRRPVVATTGPVEGCTQADQLLGDGGFCGTFAAALRDVVVDEGGAVRRLELSEGERVMVPVLVVLEQAHPVTSLLAVHLGRRGALAAGVRLLDAVPHNAEVQCVLKAQACACSIWLRSLKDELRAALRR